MREVDSVSPGVMVVGSFSAEAVAMSSAGAKVVEKEYRQEVDWLWQPAEAMLTHQLDPG